MKKIVLDAGGVLIPNFLGSLWDAIHEECGVDSGMIAERWREEMRYPLWSGAASIDDFWTWLALVCECDHTEGKLDHWRHFLRDRIHHPLPFSAYLPTLREKYQLIIWTNHCHEWVLPALTHAGAGIEHGDIVIVSSLTGFVKPASTAYRNVARIYDLPPETIYIDDGRGNLRSAKTQAGWKGIYADPAGVWISSGSALEMLMG